MGEYKNPQSLLKSGMMVNGHKTAIALFENASVDCTDPEIRAWAEARLPALKKHLEQSLICQKQCESMSSEKINMNTSASEAQATGVWIIFKYGAQTSI